MRQQTSLEFLSKLIGIPYKEKDCWDIIKLFYKYAYDVDLSEFDIVPQDREGNANQINKKSILFKEIEEPCLGDIILFRVLGHNSHVGVYLSKRHFLHTLSKTGCIIDQLSTWKRRIKGIYRWPQFD